MPLLRYIGEQVGERLPRRRLRPLLRPTLNAARRAAVAAHTDCNFLLPLMTADCTHPPEGRVTTGVNLVWCDAFVLVWMEFACKTGQLTRETLRTESVQRILRRAVGPQLGIASRILTGDKQDDPCRAAREGS